MMTSTEQYLETILAELKEALPNRANDAVAKILLREGGKLDPKLSEHEIWEVIRRRADS
jgi:hypothetical protein